jgi:hypothetical protein
MQRIALVIVAAASASLIGMVSVYAMPMSHAPVKASIEGSFVAKTAGGCGVGWHRGPYGHCVRN